MNITNVYYSELLLSAPIQVKFSKTCITFYSNPISCQDLIFYAIRHEFKSSIAFWWFKITFKKQSKLIIDDFKKGAEKKKLGRGDAYHLRAGGGLEPKLSSGFVLASSLSGLGSFSDALCMNWNLITKEISQATTKDIRVAELMAESSGAHLEIPQRARDLPLRHWFLGFTETLRKRRRWSCRLARGGSWFFLWSARRAGPVRVCKVRP